LTAQLAIGIAGAELRATGGKVTRSRILRPLAIDTVGVAVLLGGFLADPSTVYTQSWKMLLLLAVCRDVMLTPLYSSLLYYLMFTVALHKWPERV